MASKAEIRDLHLLVVVYQCSWDDKLVVNRLEKKMSALAEMLIDLILIAACKEDPDTFIFQRRLQIEGDRNSCYMLRT